MQASQVKFEDLIKDSRKLKRDLSGRTSCRPHKMLSLSLKQIWRKFHSVHFIVILLLHSILELFGSVASVATRLVPRRRCVQLLRWPEGTFVSFQTIQLMSSQPLLFWDQ